MIKFINIHMFKNNKYTKIYYQLVESAQKRNLLINTEKHHIIPKCCDGKNDLNNLVSLTPREHFLAHRLLPKMVNDEIQCKKLCLALLLMWNRVSPKLSSRLYEKLRLNHANNMKINNPMFNPEISKQFKRKRPEQSIVAIKRNLEYWKNKKRPIIKLFCNICKKEFETNNNKRLCCCKSCSATYNYRKSRVDSVPMSNPKNTD